VIERWPLGCTTKLTSGDPVASSASEAARGHLPGNLEIRDTYHAGTVPSSPYEVVTFDPNTGTVLTHQISKSDIFWGLAPVVTPLPATLPLLLTGLGA